MPYFISILKIKNIKFNYTYLYISILLKLLLVSANSSFSKSLLEEESTRTDINRELILRKTNKILVDKKNNQNSKNHEFYKLTNYFHKFLANLPNKINLINIESDFQSQEKNEFKAEGNVIINLDGKQLMVDKLIYNKTKKELTFIGNIFFKKGSQYFEATKIYYDLKNDNGYIENIYGQIDSKTLNFDLGIEINSKEKVILEREISDITAVNNDSFEIVNDNNSFNDFDISIPEINKWRFKSKKIIIEPNLLKSKQIIFTNDAYNEPQLFIESYNFEGKVNNDNIKFISRNTWLNFDNKFKLPIGKNSFVNREGFISPWGWGYDVDEKDGFFIRRGFDTKKIFGDYSLNINSYFLVQRGIKGKTKSFDILGKSIPGNEIIYQNDITDLFGLDTKLKGKLKNWNVDIISSNNSLDPNKLRESSRIKLNIHKSLDLNRNNKKNFTNNDFNKSSFLDFNFSSSYREKVSKGFSGEEEIYWGNSFSIKNKNSMQFKNNNLNYSLLYQLGQFNAVSSEREELTNLFRNLFIAEISNNTYLWRKKDLNKRISENYKYTPRVIAEGLIWRNILKSGLFIYSNDKSQKLISFITGPELTVGSLRSKFLDFTKFSSLATYTFKDGRSPFAFDDVNNSFRIKFNLEQQLYGPLVFNSETYLNLDNKDNEYGSFKETSFGLDLKRRAYNIGVFFKPNSKIIGIRFNIFNFDYSGFTPKFKK